MFLQYYTHSPKYSSAREPTLKRTKIDTQAHACVPVCLFECVYRFTHKNDKVSASASILRTHSHTHTHTHTHTHAHVHTLAHTHTHKYLYIRT